MRNSNKKKIVCIVYCYKCVLRRNIEINFVRFYWTKKKMKRYLHWTLSFAAFEQHISTALPYQMFQNELNKYICRVIDIFRYFQLEIAQDRFLQLILNLFFQLKVYLLIGSNVILLRHPLDVRHSPCVSAWNYFFWNNKFFVEIVITFIAAMGLRFWQTDVRIFCINILNFKPMPTNRKWNN